MLERVEHPLIDELKLARLPIRLSGSPIGIRKAPPLLGEDTVSILLDSGISQETIDELLSKGVIQTKKEERVAKT